MKAATIDLLVGVTLALAGLLVFVGVVGWQGPLGLACITLGRLVIEGANHAQRRAAAIDRLHKAAEMRCDR
jgi:hypothetical protein